MGDIVEETAEEAQQPMQGALPFAGAGSREAEAPRWLVGKASVRRIGRWSFPLYELTRGGETIVRMGRTGWFKVYFGNGQKIELADGELWTVRSIGAGGSICPVIVDAARRKVAMAGVAHGTYGINGKDYACVLYPAEKPRLGRANRWILRQFEDELAVVTRNPPSVEARLPVHLGAALLSLFVVRYRLPEESTPSVPAFRWGQR